MSLTYASPLSEIREQINRLFSDFVEEPMLPSLMRAETPMLQRGMWMPPIEVSENQKEVIIRAALPGIKPEEINVETMGNTLVVSGEYQRKSERGEEQKFHRTEFQYGHFMRRIPLPDYVQGESAQADFREGILELRLPKTEESKRKRIQVKAGK
ncbi:MAG TPA: Hsp20/alpha crystallin family protein [Coleofasciculaceae cyanobacterium]|jgi:HSP20 family protein